MRLRLQLLLSTVAICIVSGLVGWFFILNRLDKSIENLSKQQVAVLGQSLQSHSEIGEAFQNRDHEAINSLLKKMISSDAGLEYFLLTDANSKILGWYLSPSVNSETDLTDPEVRQELLNIFTEKKRLGSRTNPLTQKMHVLIRTGVAPKKSPSVREEDKGENQKNAERQDTQTKTPKTSPTKTKTHKTSIEIHEAQILARFAPDTLLTFREHTRWGLFLWLSLCLGLMGAMILISTKQQSNRINSLRDYALNLATGDLTHPFISQGDKTVDNIGQALNTIRKNLTKTIVTTQLASRDFDTASKHVLDSSSKITADAIDQSHAVRQTVVNFDALSENAHLIQNQARESMRSLNDTTLKIQATQKFIENFLASMQLLTKNVDQSRRRVEDKIASHNEADRSVSNLTESTRSTTRISTEITDNIRNIEASTKEALKMSTDATIQAETGVSAFRESLASIQKISVNADESASSIRFLSEKTSSIEHILEVIDDISNRTRLLSLNASIIASHSGETGRGFMIVADEIKDLATRTAGSTREISKIIREVKDGSDQALQIVERGIRAVNSSVKRAEIAGGIATQIVASTHQMGQQVEEISHTTSRQAQGTRQINNALKEMLSSTTQIKATVRAQKVESRDLESSIRTTRIQLSRMVASTKRQMADMQDAILGLGGISQQIRRIDNFNSEQMRNQESTSEAIERLRKLSDLAHSSADRLSLSIEQSTEQSRIVTDGFKSFRL